jgi:hypothetical protein
VDQTGDLLKQLAELISKNPPVVVAVFLLSLIANLIQIGTYIRDRRRLKYEEEERKRLTKLVDTYEDVLQIAKETVEDKGKLATLKTEIQETSSKAAELTAKIAVLQKAAQQKLVTQAIDYNLGILSEAYTEVARLREQYRKLGDLPDLPRDSRAAIESEVEIAVKKPYTLPREFVFRSALLVLLLLLLPWPVDVLLLPFLVRYFILTFFDAIWLYPNRNVKNFVIRHYSLLIFLAEFGVWLGFLQALQSILSPIWSGFLAILINSAPSIDTTVAIVLAQILNVTPILIGIFLGVLGWRSLKHEVKEQAIPKIESTIEIEI